MENLVVLLTLHTDHDVSCHKEFLDLRPRFLSQVCIWVKIVAMTLKNKSMSFLPDMNPNCFTEYMKQVTTMIKMC